MKGCCSAPAVEGGSVDHVRSFRTYVGTYRMFALLRNFFSQFLADFDV